MKYKKSKKIQVAWAIKTASSYQGHSTDSCLVDRW